MTDNLPHNDVNAEANLLSSMLLSAEGLTEARDMVSAGDFYTTANKVLFESMLRIDDAGERVDVTVVLDELRSRNLLENDAGRLGELMALPWQQVLVPEWCRIIREKSKLRAVVSALREQLAVATGEVQDVDSFLAEAESSISHACERGESESEPVQIGEAAAKVVVDTMAAKNAGVTPGKRSGIKSLDTRLGNWSSNLYVIAGRPGMGKSALAMGILEGICEKEDEVGVFVSLEMPKEQLAQRRVSARGRVPLSRIRSATVTDEMHTLMVNAASKLKDTKLYIEEARSATVAQVRAIVRKAMRAARKKFGKEVKLGAICVDYIQIMTGQGHNRENEISGIMRGLVAMPAEFDCPVIALSQINRGVEDRSVKNKRPGLSDLRESGAIEQDSYGVMFVYRDDYYTDGNSGEAEIIIAKSRNGGLGTVILDFRSEYTLFEDRPSDKYDFGEALPAPDWHD